MRVPGAAILLVGGAVGLTVCPAGAQTSRLNHLPPARAPCSVLSGRPCHPSFCGVFHRGPCLPYEEPTLPETLRLTITSTDENDPANGAGEPDQTTRPGEDAVKAGQDAEKAADKKNEEADKAADDHELDTIRDMFAALRDCWVPPPKDEARHGMEYTIRFAFKRDGAVIAPPRMTYASHDAPQDVRNVYRGAIDAALKRCTPLHFSEGMGDAIAGRPIAIRFVDERTIDKDSGK
jgi:hypothetical protein